MQNLRNLPEGRVIGIAPTHLALVGAIEEMKDANILVGAQNAYWEESGAFTGQVSMAMLKDTGADFCIIGHSEQRQFFGETDETVNKKLKSALALDLKPIICVGETLEERESGKMNDVLKTQILQGLQGVTLQNAEDLVLAYEPIWAIGTGKNSHT